MLDTNCDWYQREYPILNDEGYTGRMLGMFDIFECLIINSVFF